MQADQSSPLLNHLGKDFGPSRGRPSELSEMHPPPRKTEVGTPPRRGGNGEGASHTRPPPPSLPRCPPHITGTPVSKISGDTISRT